MVSVLKWFNSLENKEKFLFICFDVCEFYFFINEKLFLKVFDFVNKYWFISSNECDIILYVKCLLLFNNGFVWEKKFLNDFFDVIMGFFDGVEMCELVGCYLLFFFIDKYG